MFFHLSVIWFMLVLNHSPYGCIIFLRSLSCWNTYFIPSHGFYAIGHLRHLVYFTTKVPGWETKAIVYCNIFCTLALAFLSYWYNTVDSRYLEFQGTLWNSSRYPYYDISDFCRIEEKLIGLITFNKYICNWILEVRNTCILKILWKRGEIAP